MKQKLKLQTKFHYDTLMSKKFSKSNLHNNFWIVLILTGIILFAFIPLRTLDSSDFSLISWIPGQQLLKTGSVYAEYPYPMWTLVLMSPLALLPVKVAEIIWFFCNWLLLAGSITVLISICNWKLSLQLFALVVFFSGFFLPVITSVSLGQLTVFSLFLLTLFIYFFFHQRYVWLGVVIGLSFIKPHVLILLAGFLLLWALWQRRWHVWIGFGIVFIPLVLISLPFISFAGQLIGGGIGSHVLSHLRESDTLWSLILNFGLPFFIPLLICLGLLVWQGWIWLPHLRGKGISTNEVLFLFSSTVLVNLLVIPYSWMHNFILLLLPFIYSFSLAIDLQHRLRTVFFLVIIMVMNSFYLSLFIDQPPQSIKMVPAVLLFPLMLFLRSKTKEESIAQNLNKEETTP